MLSPSCPGQRMLLEHERYYGLGTDALGTDALVNRVLSKTDVIMVQ